MLERDINGEKSRLLKVLRLNADSAKNNVVELECFLKHIAIAFDIAIFSKNGYDNQTEVFYLTEYRNCLVNRRLHLEGAVRVY